MDEDRLNRLEQRLDELDQRSTSLERTVDRAMDRSRAAMNTIVPRETQRHMRAAWRENLLALRSLIDYWADRLADKPSPDSGEATSGREKIQID
jgi:predicted  nucleic acid-binding Zn-ribbon protein